MNRRAVACGTVLAAWAAVVAATSAAQAPLAVPPPPQECNSVVIVKCEAPAAADRAKQEAARRADARRTAQATQELDRIIIEGDSERRSPEQTLDRALARPLVKRGETTFPVGEGAQCTCLDLCPPWPLPCCSCTPQPGSRHATSPGWKPTQ
jgi:hypothetical protein